MSKKAIEKIKRITIRTPYGKVTWGGKFIVKGNWK